MNYSCCQGQHDQFTTQQGITGMQILIVRYTRSAHQMFISSTSNVHIIYVKCSYRRSRSNVQIEPGTRPNRVERGQNAVAGTYVVMADGCQVAQVLYSGLSAGLGHPCLSSGCIGCSHPAFLNAAVSISTTIRRCLLTSNVGVVKTYLHQAWTGQHMDTGSDGTEMAKVPVED